MSTRQWMLCGRVLKRPFAYADRFGVDLLVYPEDDVKGLLNRQVHFDDEGVLRLLPGIVRPGMTIFDVGANYGQFSMYVAGLVGETGKVHAFEPASYSFARLAENARRRRKSGDVSLVLNHVAVGEVKGCTTLHTFPPHYSAWNSRGCYPMEGPDGALVPNETEEVEQTTLDEYCDSHAVSHMDLLKIDVEGFEQEVLEGASRSIAAGLIERIIFEISLAPLTGLGRNPSELVSLLGSMGFTVSCIGRTGRIVAIDNQAFRFPFHANYLATKSSNFS